ACRLVTACRRIPAGVEELSMRLLETAVGAGAPWRDADNPRRQRFRVGWSESSWQNDAGQVAPFTLVRNARAGASAGTIRERSLHARPHRLRPRQPGLSNVSNGAGI